MNKKEKEFLDKTHRYLRDNGVFNFLEFRGTKYRWLRIYRMFDFVDTSLTLDECKSFGDEAMLDIVRSHVEV